jgi:hypothetical protein
MILFADEKSVFEFCPELRPNSSYLLVADLSFVASQDSDGNVQYTVTGDVIPYFVPLTLQQNMQFLICFLGTYGGSDCNANFAKFTNNIILFFSLVDSVEVKKV